MVVLPEDSGPKTSRHAAAGNAAHAQRRVKADGAGGDDGNGHQRLLGAEPDNRPFAKLFFDLCEGKFYGFGAVIGDGHGEGSLKCSPDAGFRFLYEEIARRHGMDFDGIVAGLDRDG